VLAQQCTSSTTNTTFNFPLPVSSTFDQDCTPQIKPTQRFSTYCTVHEGHHQTCDNIAQPCALAPRTNFSRTRTLHLERGTTLVDEDGTLRFAVTPDGRNTGVHMGTLQLGNADPAVTNHNILSTTAGQAHCAGSCWQLLNPAYTLAPSWPIHKLYSVACSTAKVTPVSRAAAKHTPTHPDKSW
jgi:hypothetical protein